MTWKIHKTHRRIADDPEADAGEHTQKYWRKAAAGYHRQLEDIIQKARLPESYLEEIDKEGKEEVERLYKKKKKEMRK